MALKFHLHLKWLVDCFIHFMLFYKLKEVCTYEILRMISFFDHYTRTRRNRLQFHFLYFVFGTFQFLLACNCSTLCTYNLIIQINILILKSYLIHVKVKWLIFNKYYEMKSLPQCCLDRPPHCLPPYLAGIVIFRVLYIFPLVFFLHEVQVAQVQSTK